MAELFEEVVAILESRSATRALASEFRIDSEKAAGNGAVLGVPLFIAKLAEWADNSSGSQTLLNTLRSIDTVGLQDPGAAIEGRLYEPTGSELTDLLIGTNREYVAGVISGEAGISERSASGLLPTTAWAVMASIADRYGNRLDGQSLLSILEREQSDLIDGGWGPWLDAVVRREDVPARAMTHAAVDSGAATTDQPTEYPPPVSRSHRSPGQESSMRAAGPAGRSALGGASPASPTVGFSDHDPIGMPLADEIPEVAGRNRLFGLLLGAALLLLALAAAVWFVSNRDSSDDADSVQSTDTTDAAVDETASTTAAAPTDTADAGAPTEQLAFDVMMADEKGISDSTGLAELRFDPEAGEICYNINAERIGTPYEGHIHAGPSGVKGGIIVDFGFVDNYDIGCVEVAATDMQAILDDPANHYVEMHDPGGVWTIRAQLSDAVSPAETSDAEAQFDPDGGGAVTTISAGQITLDGEVADQATMDLLLADVSGLDDSEIQIVNNLTIAEGAPLPTGRIAVDSSILFAVDSDVLDTQDPVILAVAVLVTARPDWKLTVVGHTDSSGPEVYNLELSKRRAEAVRDALIGFDVPEANLTIRGAGDTDPVGDNATPDGRAQNRRIEFEVDRG